MASWSLGVRDEEGPSENMVFATSDDQGKTWTEPRVVGLSRPGRVAGTVVVSSGIRSVDDSLIACFGHWDRTQVGISPDGSRTPNNDPAGEIFADVRTEARVSHDGGSSWTPPVVVAPDISNYMPPFKTSTGRLILPGNLTGGRMIHKG